MKMLSVAGVLAVVALGLSASHTKGTVGEGQLPPPGAPPRVRRGSAKREQKYSEDGEESAVALLSLFKVCAGLSSDIFLASSLFLPLLSSLPRRRTFTFCPSFGVIVGLHLNIRTSGGFRGAWFGFRAHQRARFTVSP